MKAISIKQPWASLIVHGFKDIENRTWACPKKYIGQRILIHASLKPVKCDNLFDLPLTTEQILSLPQDLHFDNFYFKKGAIIGSVIIKDCVENHPSIWAEKGNYHWVLSEPTLYDKPISAKGKLSFWDFDDIQEVKIECPECGTIQPALIDCTSLPWDTYVHECKQCHYMITESDWEEVK